MIISDDIGGYYSLKPIDYRTIVDFRIVRNLHNELNSLTIYFEMRTNSLRSDKALKYYSDDCRELKIGNVDSLSGIFIEIEPCRSPFFERTRFKVFDSEMSREIEFLCAGFAIEAS